MKSYVEPVEASKRLFDMFDIVTLIDYIIAEQERQDRVV